VLNNDHVLNNDCFQIVVIDDASSAPEPLAMMSLLRFSCEKLIMAGDLKFEGMRSVQWESSIFGRCLSFDSRLVLF